MDTEMVRGAVLALLEEVYVGPPDPKGTWVTSNEVGAGVLGTLRKLDAAKAFAKPPGARHSIAEHAAHLRFALQTGLRYAKGDFSPADWKTSWNVSATWDELLAGLERDVAAIRAFAGTEEKFADRESVTGFMGCVAHGAYHLGAIRQLAVIH